MGSYSGRRLLRETLVHLDGIGPETEARLWRAGVTDWNHLRSTRFGRRAATLRTIADSEAALLRNDLHFFFHRLPPAERWRVFWDFPDQFVAVDIETTGLSTYDVVTLIGIEVDGEYRTFLRGANLHEAIPILEGAPGLVTFNGTLFDLPFIRRTFPEIRLPSTHLDLRFLSRRVGLKGSLKAVERSSGLNRPPELAALGGFAATVLWSEFVRERNLSALETLIKYNAADTTVLRPLCQTIVNQLATELRDVSEESDRAHNQGSLFIFTDGAPVHAPLPVTDPVIPEIHIKSDDVSVGAKALRVPMIEDARPVCHLKVLLAQVGSTRIVGIDLAGSERKGSGWALLTNDVAVTRVLADTKDIIDVTIAAKPDLVSIDSPLALPVGRHCVLDSCECRRAGISRSCERELKRRGISVYWCLIQSMQALTIRGIEIAKHLREAGIEVIESYPGAAQDIMRIPRKRASLAQLRVGLTSFGVQGIPNASELTHDELDAITSAVVGMFYRAGHFEALGDPEEGCLIVPDISRVGGDLM